MLGARSIEDVLLGEAVSGSRSQRFADMIAIASAVKNRMDRLGQPVHSVVSAPGQFSAYGKPLPAGAERHRAAAKAAWDYVMNNGPTHRGMFYSTPKAVGNLPSGLAQVTKTAGHVFFEDPHGRTIQTAAGYVQPAAAPVAQVAPTAAQTLSPTLASANSAMRVAEFDPVSVSTGAPPAQMDGVARSGLNYTHGSTRGDVMNGLTDEARRSLQMMEANSRSPVTVTSALRTPVQNAAAGSGRGSQHLHGNAYDIDLTGMTDAERAKTVEMARMSGATRVGAYSGNNSIHVDFVEGFAPTSGYAVDVHPMFDKSVRNMAQAPDWFQNGLSQTTVPTPSPRPDPQAATPVAKGTDAATVLGLAAAPAGKVERAALGPAAPRLDTVAASPTGEAQRASLAPAMASGPAYSSWWDGGAAKAAPRSNGPAPSLTPATLGQGDMVAPSFASARMTAPAVSAPAQSFAPPSPTISAPSTLPAPNAGMSLAAQYASYGAGKVPPATPAMNAMLSPMPTMAQSFVSQGPMPTFVSSIAAPRPTIPAPVRQAVRSAAGQFPPAPPAPPQMVASDIYGGATGSARATGGNTVSRFSNSQNTYVTNAYGKTTAIDPNGRQMAVHGAPGSGKASKGISGPLGGQGSGIGSIFDADPQLGGRSKFGNTARTLGGSMAGSAVGSLGGPVGSLIGAAIGAELSKPGGGRLGEWAAGLKTVNTANIPSMMGMTFGPTTQFYRPVNGLQFPTAPSGVRGALGGRESNRSYTEMRDISPRAADAISKGQGGLY
ncbi:D-Ala-D-Ala carboxypeptidase family metallohydrolase [Mesorhizobium sp. ANAO-SY3R2]|uniref:D-Ala-D-Ala carboxypeptidase family metallohydrolase n=1 Tax=Mesorhizobium sp. ANAO-SY3R2 TaxID=3166644 RepID=UPI0036711956